MRKSHFQDMRIRLLLFILVMRSLSQSIVSKPQSFRMLISES